MVSWDNGAEGRSFMDEFGCDYECRTVGESIAKYSIPDEWCAEFDACDGIYPLVCIPIAQIRNVPTLMNLKLRIVKNPNDEYAGCMILSDQKTVAFKVDAMSDLIKAMGKE